MREKIPGLTVAVFGGDTLISVMEALTLRSIEPLGELAQGTVRQARGRDADRQGGRLWRRGCHFAAS
jgi:hypothetical protein